MSQPSATSPAPAPAPVRVLMYTAYLEPEFSGAALQALTLARELRRRGHVVEFVTNRWPGLGATAVVDGFAVHRLEPGRMRKHREFRLWLNLARYAWARRRDFDVLHSHGAYYTHAFVGVLGRLVGMRSLVKASLASNDLLGAVRRTLAGLLHRLMLRRVDACVAISRDLIDEFQACGVGALAIHHIPNGVDTGRFRPPAPGERQALRAQLGLPAEAPVVLYVGVLDRRKNIGWLAQQWVQHDGYGSGALLLVVGPHSRDADDAALPAQIDALAAAHPQRLRRLPFQADVAPLYRCADLVVLPSLQEGLPNAVLEGMASGLPCVVACASGSRELVADGVNGWGYAQGDAAALGQAVRACLGADGAAMGREARRIALARYGIATVAQRYEQLYAALLAAPRKPPLLMITELYLPTKGGTAVMFEDDCRRLGGREVHVVTAAVPGDAAFDTGHPNTVHRLPLRRYEWLRPESLWMYLRLLGRALRLALPRRPAAVLAGRALPEGLIAWVVGRLRGARVVVYAHGEELTGWGRGGKFRTMCFTLRRANCVIANSDFTRDTLVTLIGVDAQRIVMAYPTVDPERFRPGLPCADLRARIGLAPAQRLLLSVGRLQRRKGFDQVVRALPGLVARGVDVHYAIVGIGEDHEHLQQIAAAAGVRERLHLLGHVEPEDLPRWYNACDLFAMPNRDIGGDTEGFGIVYLEANACARPALAGVTGGTGSAVEHEVNGLRADGDSVEAVEAALARLLTEPGLAQRLGQAGRERILAGFTPERRLQKLREAIGVG
jgi:phosphatidylinositol alpha-1,6-mannosyltransferase